ncbi:Uncharacterized protein BP5553_08013 [Venustampulla echinocandica]|uniref:Maintenance of telomere capping protein 6 n=1 Tax=Venustampulla echinocandica TaxID=2656787 RepID=A0A370TFH2_9HELO|nr:Uncharacterized protein BP5553_08013 [Venustampulla echinocandica]RDL33645.1 Uncharacterized protein BP5553_08013 [Venustampulla echinocandica]
MSETYSPDPGAVPQSPYGTVFLSQRDLGLRIPINYVTSPGVSLTAACFSDMKYVDDDFNDCFSNLLAVGFRRFEIDLYWDQGSGMWSLCPVATSSSIQQRALVSHTPLTVFSASLTAPTLAIEQTLSPSSVLNARQVTTTNPSSPFPATSMISEPSTTSLGDTSSSSASLPNNPSASLISAGRYVCTTSIDISVFIHQLLDYFQQSQNTLDAHLLYVFLNMHAALSNTAQPQSAPTTTSLPDSSNLLGNHFSGNLSAFLYTPNDLRLDRANLNDSWYTVTERYRPIEDYYSVTKGEHDIVSTEDGWPSEGFVEFSRGKRLLLGWGTVDAEMAGYDLGNDSKTIFAKDYIQNIRTDFAANSSGGPTIGCFLQSTDDLSQVNSSWAAATIPPSDYPTATSGDITPLLTLATNTTNCGISPILNLTLLNSTAHENYRPYQSFSYATIWSWAPGEPKNYTSSGSTAGSMFRCATVNPNLAGRWVVADCSQEYYAACRSKNHSYNWTISDNPTSYYSALEACPADYVFSPPRTALENSYLNQAVRKTARDYGNHGIWVDFNCLEVQGCWSTGGENATCVYSDFSSENPYLRKKYILVATIATVIVLVITALTIFVKAVGNRKSRRRSKKRIDNGLVYEGVPS